MDARLCECGCGEPTPLARSTDKRWGLVKGAPIRFVPGHAGRRSPVEYREEDRGYATPCWIWQRARSKGYGSHYVPALKTNKNAYLLYYEARYGPVPAGKELDHLCRVTLCVNPDHLEPVPRAINVRRGRSAKLNQAQVDAIRSNLALTGRAAAKFYGVSPALISLIRSGACWKEVL